MVTFSTLEMSLILSQAHNGCYLLDSHIADPTNAAETLKSWATNPIEAEALWQLSEELVGQTFAY